LEIRDLWPDSLLGIKRFQNKWIIRLFRKAEKVMYRQAKIIVINSKGFLKHIQKEIEKTSKKIIYLPNGANEKELSVKRHHNNHFRIIYTGNVGLAQDIHRLKKLARRLHERGFHFD